MYLFLRQWLSLSLCLSYLHAQQAIVILARTATNADYMEPIWMAEDAVGIGKAPRYYHRPAVLAISHAFPYPSPPSIYLALYLSL